MFSFLRRLDTIMLVSYKASGDWRLRNILITFIWCVAVDKIGCHKDVNTLHTTSSQMSCVDVWTGRFTRRYQKHAGSTRQGSLRDLPRPAVYCAPIGWKYHCDVTNVHTTVCGVVERSRKIIKNFLNGKNEYNFFVILAMKDMFNNWWKSLSKSSVFLSHGGYSTMQCHVMVLLQDFDISCCR